MEAGRREAATRSLLLLEWESHRIEWLFLRIGDRKDLGACFRVAAGFFKSLVRVRAGRLRDSVLSRAGARSLVSRFPDDGMLSHRDTTSAA